nr:hypothetical protein [Tanacetum cinerariifolium]
QLRIVLSIEDKLHYLEHPIPPVPKAPEGQQVAPEELKTLFAQQAEQELFQTTRDFHSCKQEERQSVSSYVLKIKGYIDNLERLGHPVTLGLGQTEKPESINDTYVVDKDDINITPDSLDTCNDEGKVDQDTTQEEERALFSSLIENMKHGSDESKKINKELKKANMSLYSELTRYKESNYVKESDIKFARTYGLLNEQKAKLDKSCSEAGFQVFDIKQKFSELEKQLLAHINKILTLQYEKDEQKKFYKTREDKEIERVICLENQVKSLNDNVYKTDLYSSREVVFLVDKWMRDKSVVPLSWIYYLILAIERMVKKRVTEAIAEYERNRANPENVIGSGPANAGGFVAPDVHRRAYKTFLNCKPHTFNGTEGVVGLTRWFEKMKQVFEISKCADKDKVKFTAFTFEGCALTWWNGNEHTLRLTNANQIPWYNVKTVMITKYCTTTEIQRMEQELDFDCEGR